MLINVNERPMGPRKSLSEIMGSAPRLPRIEGIVTVVLRNADGSMADFAHKRNLITDFYRDEFVRSNGFALFQQNVFINENVEAMHRVRTSMRTVLSGTFAQIVTASKDGPNRLWTYSTVFSAPPSNRTFRTVGLCETKDESGFTGVRGGPKYIIAATVLGSPITQLTTQTLEVTYRLAFQRT